MTLVFDGDLAAVAGAEETAERTTFVTTLQNELSAALGLSGATSGRVRITGLAALATAGGGFAANVTILPPAATDTGPAAANVTSVADSLAAAARNTSSSLYTGAISVAMLNGAGNANAQASVTNTAPASILAPRGGCDPPTFTVRLASAMTMSWSLVTGSGQCLAEGAEIPDDAKLVAAVAVSSEDTWLALGWNENFDMVGTDAVLGTPNNGFVRDVHITSKGNSGVQSDTSRDITDTQLRSTDGFTVMFFTRPLNTGDDAEDANLLPAAQAGEASRVIWAHGGAGAASLGNHNANRGNLFVNFATGATTAVDPDGLRLAHGILMTIAWALMVPLAILSAVWLKPGTDARCCGMLRPAVEVDTTQPQVWFTIHWRLQLAAFVLATAAFVLALIFTDLAPPATPHATLGLVVYVLMAVQVGAGLMRPHKPKPEQPTSGSAPYADAQGAPQGTCLRTVWEAQHRITGALLPLLAIIALVTGYLVFNAGIGIAIGVPLGTLVLTLAAGCCTLRGCVPAGAQQRRSSRAPADGDVELTNPVRPKVP